MIAYDYPLLGVFWSLLLFSLFFAWIVLLFRTFIDVFRNGDLGGFSKALWAIGIILIPFLGVFVYLLVHGQGMGQRDMAQAQAQDEAFKAYVRNAAGSGGTADELTRLADLNARGVLTDAEFAQQKAKLLS